MCCIGDESGECDGQTLYGLLCFLAETGSGDSVASTVELRNDQCNTVQCCVPPNSPDLSSIGYKCRLGLVL